MTTEIAESPPPAMTMNELVGKYIELRNKKSEIKKSVEAKVEKIDELLDKIEALMLLRFQEMGVESVRTDAGTAYVALQTSASLGDADTFKEFCRQQDDPFTFVDVRVNKSAVSQFKEAMGGELPPGVNFTATRVVNFRKS